MAFLTPSPLINPIATIQQLQASSSSLDGLPISLEDSVRFETCRLVQTAGTLLRMPQDLIAQAIVLVCRFWTSSEGASMLEHDGQDVAAAALYIAAKPSGHTLLPRLLLMVFAYLAAVGPLYEMGLDSSAAKVSWSLKEGEYESQRAQLYAMELLVLSVLGFNTHVALPFSVCINYIQALDVFKTSQGTLLARRTFQYLNSALFSPQLLYLTYQPSALATAAIYLAAREVAVKLPETEWWEVFDVDREDLGFLVVALQSTDGFVQQESKRWVEKRSLVTVREVKAAMEKP